MSDKRGNQSILEKLFKRKKEGLTSLKGGYREYLTFMDLKRRFEGKNVVDLALKAPDSHGPAFVFKVIEGDKPHVHIVYVIATDDPGSCKLSNDMLYSNNGYNISHAVLLRGDGYFRDASGNSLQIYLDVYVYGESNAIQAENMLKQLPPDKVLKYHYREKGNTDIKLGGEAIANILPGTQE